MKFNCDRCKTRYSISDERVSGKVLKIRCKNCSAVITVREGMTASAPRTPTASSKSEASRLSPRPRTDSALRGAFDEAMKAPSAADSMTGAPASLAIEWYMAIDGNQSGPFDLSAAQGWIQTQSGAAELYCWSEGFDDWLPIEKVSQFRGARNGSSNSLGNGATAAAPALQPKGAGPMPSFGASSDALGSTVEKTPAPLFKSTMEQVAAEAPTLLEDDDPFSPSYKPASGAEPSGLDAQADAARDAGSGGAFEFDIGEASRVVNLASLVPPSSMGAAAPVSGSASSLPGLATPVTAPIAKQAGRITGTTGPDVEPLRPEILQPATTKKSRVLLPLLIASGALLVVLGVLLFLAFRSGDDQEEIARGGGVGGEDLAHQYDYGDGRDEGKGSKKVDVPEKGPKAGSGSGSGSGSGTGTRKGTRKNGNGKTTNTGTTSGSNSKRFVPGDGEIDLTGSRPVENIRQGSLEPGDIITVYRKSQFSVNRCYERAIKKNPLLKVGRTNITLRVSGGGKVTSVSIPSLAGQSLGSCLVVAINRWRFPKSTEGFRGTFPIVFK